MYAITKWFNFVEVLHISQILWKICKNWTLGPLGKQNFGLYSVFLLFECKKVHSNWNWEESKDERRSRIYFDELGIFHQNF